MVKKSLRYVATNRLSFNSQIAGRLGVSPYAVFLQGLAGTDVMKSKGFEERGHRCAHLWYNMDGSVKNIIRRKAASMPLFPHNKNQTPHKPPPFARWIQKNWHLAPPAYTFEEKTVYLAKVYSRVSTTSRTAPYVGRA